MNARELDACANRLEEFLVTMLTSVGRSERRHHGLLYVQGLLLDGERKSIEPLAERVPEGNVQALQQFVGQSPWAWEPVRRLLAQHMGDALLPTAGWIVQVEEKRCKMVFDNPNLCVKLLPEWRRRGPSS